MEFTEGTPESHALCAEGNKFSQKSVLGGMLLTGYAYSGPCSVLVVWSQATETNAEQSVSQGSVTLETS